MGMKCKKIFEPNTTKISPRRTRAIIVAIFIEGSWLDREGNPTTKFWNDAKSVRILKSPRFVAQCAWLLASVRNGGIPTDIAPANRSDIPSDWERRGEFMRAARHSPRCDFVLIDCGRASRGAVFLEIRQKCVAADYCAAVLLP